MVHVLITLGGRRELKLPRRVVELVLAAATLVVQILRCAVTGALVGVNILLVIFSPLEHMWVASGSASYCNCDGGEAVRF